MPVLQMKTNYRFEENAKNNFMQDMTKLVSDILNKPLGAVMGMISEESMCMNCSDDTCFFLELRFVENGSEEERKAAREKITDAFFEKITEYTKVASNRVYMQLTAMDPQDIWRYVPKA